MSGGPTRIAPKAYEGRNEQQARSSIETRLRGSESTMENELRLYAETLTLANGANSDISMPSVARFIRITGPSAAFSVTGFQGGYEAKRIIIYNTTAQDMTLTNNATSAAANRILTLTGGNVTIRGAGVAHFIYSVADLRWVLEDTFDAVGPNMAFADNTGITDDSGNEQLTFQKTASAVNQWDVTNAATGGKPNLAATGDDMNIIGRLDGKGTGGLEIKGTGTSDSATAGYIGEYISSSVTVGVAFVASGTAIDVTSISLTAGDWDVAGVVIFDTGTVSTSRLQASTSTTSATIDSVPVSSGFNIYSFTISAGNPTSVPIARHRRSLSATTTVYLVANATYGGTNPTAKGFISARRVR